MAVRVRVYEDHMGNVFGYPLKEDLQTQIATHMAEMTGLFDHRFFFQEGGPAEQFKDENLSKRQRTEIEHGQACYINVDPWILGHFYGYDTHTLFE